MTTTSSGCGRLVTFGSVRSSAVTTTAMAVGCAWPDPQGVLLVEADPAGGTLAATLGLTPAPGLVSLATAARRDPQPELVAEHAQLLPCGLGVVAGPPTAGQARTALGMLNDPLSLLTATGRDVLVDCGRLDPHSPAEGLFAAAVVSLLVVRPQLADLHALAGWLEAHPDLPARQAIGVVLAGPGPYGAGEITDALGVPVWGALPWDRPAVAALGQVPGRRARASTLLRAATTLAAQLHDLLAAPGDQQEAASTPASPPGEDTTGSDRPSAAARAAADRCETATGPGPAGVLSDALAGQARDEH